MCDTAPPDPRTARVLPREGELAHRGGRLGGERGTATVTINDNAVAAVARHGRQLVALVGAAALIHWAHTATPGPGRIAAVASAAFLVALAVALPTIDRWRQPRTLMPPPSPDNPDDHYAYL